MLVRELIYNLGYENPEAEVKMDVSVLFEPSTDYLRPVIQIDRKHKSPGNPDNSNKNATIVLLQDAL